MTDLFRWSASYPERAGYREPSTSREAARAIEATGRAATLRADVLAYFKAGRQATADEVAEALHESVLSIRPRVAELKASGQIVETGLRRKSSTGRSSHVWRAV
jgi:predicted ArsR family transcriptional regulator